MRFEQAIILYPLLVVALFAITTIKRGLNVITLALTVSVIVLSLAMYRRIKGKQPQF